MADGSLNFDTRINTDGFYNGIDEITDEVNDLRQDINDIPDVDIDVNVDTQPAEDAADHIRESMDSVRDAAENTADHINEDMSDVRNAARDTASSVSDNVRAASRNAENRVDSAADHIEESLRKVQSGFKKLLALVGVTLSAGAIIAYGKKSVEAAAEVNAANSQLAQTFGELEANATDAMARVAKASGIVQTRLQGVGTSVYAFARTSGMDTAQALGMMEEALRVAADSAAYYDRSLEDTSETLLSFLKGNYANDAALGLSATETTRNAAANKLYGKSFQELSEAQKQLTLLQMVKDANALSGAEGQAAREAEGWENVIGNLRESWRQLLAVVGQPILKLAISWVQQLTDALIYLTEKARIAINTLAALFGKEVEDTADAAENITQSVSAQEALTDAVEDTVKAENKSLAGFDKINTVASDKSASSGKKSGGSSGAAVTPSIKVKDNTKQTSKRLERFIKSTRRLFGGFLNYLDRNFSPSFKKVWTMLSPEIKRFGETCGEIFSDIKELGPPLLDYLNGDFTSLLRTFIETAGEILTGLFNSFNTVFEDIWEEAAYPILQTFITDGLPLISQFCEEAIKSYGTLFKEVKEGFDSMWKDAAKPALGEVAKIWNDTIKILKQTWDNHGKQVFEKFRKAIENVGNTFQNVWNTIFKPVFEKMMGIIDELWEEHGKELLKNFLDLAVKLGEIALDIYNKFISPLVNWFVKTLGPAIAKVLSGMLENFGEKIGGIMTIMNDLLTVLNDVLDFVQDVFEGDWDDAWKSIKKAFEDVWKLFADIVKVPLNTIIGMINKFIDGIQYALNLVISGLNKISFDIPDWVPDWAGGGKSFGIHISKVSLKHIPPLAQGTVVPANYGNFLAMLGDNKREPEVVSPLSTIEKAVENALARMGGKEQTIHVHVDLDGREIGKVAVKAVRDDNVRKGAA